MKDYNTNLGKGVVKKILLFVVIIFSLFFGFSSFSPNYVSAYGYSSLSPVFHNFSEVLFDTHMSIGQHYHDFGSFGKIATIIKNLRRYNIIEVSNYGWLSDEEYTLSYQLLQDSEALKDSLKSKLNAFKTKENACWNKKKLYDKKFYLALDYLSVASMENAMQSAIESEWCATDARVHYNSYKELYDILDYQYKIFSDRYHYWRVKRAHLKHK